MHHDAGFTVLEVLIAIVVLSMGVIALAGTAALVTRMISHGRTGTEAAALLESRLETLRADAFGTTPACSGLVGGSALHAAGITESWWVGPASPVRELGVAVRHPAGSRFRTDTVITRISCG
jgi:Tfp pilus assembly protein FimT